MNKSKKFFVTTPIYYINDIPHMGHAYSTFAADILARYHRAKNERVFFLTGTDENSQKTVVAAEQSKKKIQVYTDELALKWQKTWDNLGITNDDFIRTTETRHKKVVGDIFKRIEKSGDIYKGKYEGLYCVGHEAFLRNDDLNEKGLCPDHKTKPDTIVEENYFFRLSKYQNKLLNYFETNPSFVQPKERYNEVVSFIDRGLQDISITRQTQKWGIPAPNDPKQVIYVWFDALINYISADPDKWPADLHIIGKDILRFHAVIWPAMLFSAGYPLPKKIFAHGFFTVNGEKISKSLGNAIDPVQLSEDFKTDTLRYYLFKEIPFGNDGDFSVDKLKEVYNSDLANGLGNLVSRVAKLCETAKLVVEPPPEKNSFDTKFDSFLGDLKFQDALNLIWYKITNTDKLIDQSKPWELVKKDVHQARKLLTKLVAEIRAINTHLIPFLPETSKKISQQFTGPKIKSSAPLFPRIK